MTTTGTLDQVICASAQATAALTERDNLIRKALTEGHTLRAVGQAAGLTHQGVAKIRDRGYDRGSRRSGGGAAVIRVERARVYPSVARRGPAWKWVYNCVGPDGRRFDNDSIVTLRDVLRRAYPGVEIVEPWKVG